MGEAYVSDSQCYDFLTVHIALKLHLFNLQIYCPQAVSSGEISNFTTVLTGEGRE